MPKMSWDKFIEKVESFRGPGVPVGELVKLVKNLELTEELIAPHVSWNPETYQRNPLYRSEKLEALVLCWEDGQETVIHDHGPSCSVACVYQGTTKLENFRRADKGEKKGFAKLDVIESCDVKPGDCCASDVGGIHSMGNHQGGKKRMITVNFYSPPLSKIQTFDRATGAIGERVYPALLATL